jgi:hypothetical protein
LLKYLLYAIFNAAKAPALEYGTGIFTVRSHRHSLDVRSGNAGRVTRGNIAAVGDRRFGGFWNRLCRGSFNYLPFSR